jgi:hypothetical protein
MDEPNDPAGDSAPVERRPRRRATATSAPRPRRGAAAQARGRSRVELNGRPHSDPDPSTETRERKLHAATAMPLRVVRAKLESVADYSGDAILEILVPDEPGLDGQRSDKWVRYLGDIRLRVVEECVLGVSDDPE